MDSQACEAFVHEQLIQSGYRNIRDGKYGPQEMFQAPVGSDYQSVVNFVLGLVKKWEKEYTHIDHKASDLVGGYTQNYPLNNVQKFLLFIKAFIIATWKLFVLLFPWALAAGLIFVCYMLVGTFGWLGIIPAFILVKYSERAAKHFNLMK